MIFSVIQIHETGENVMFLHKGVRIHLGWKQLRKDDIFSYKTEQTQTVL